MKNRTLHAPKAVRTKFVAPETGDGRKWNSSTKSVRGKSQKELDKQGDERSRRANVQKQGVVGFVRHYARA